MKILIGEKSIEVNNFVMDEHETIEVSRGIRELPSVPQAETHIIQNVEHLVIAVISSVVICKLGWG